MEPGGARRWDSQTGATSESGQSRKAATPGRAGAARDSSEGMVGPDLFGLAGTVSRVSQINPPVRQGAFDFGLRAACIHTTACSL